VRRLLLVLLVVGGVAVLGDRAAAAYAGRTVAAELQATAGLATAPEVDVRGFPFVAQALRGEYQQVDVRATGVPAGDVELAELTATLSGVRVPLRDVFGGRVGAVPVEDVEARALLSYDSLSRRSGDRALTVTPAGEAVQVRGSVRLLGKELAASTTSTVVLDGEDVVVTAQEVEVGNEAAGRAVSRALGNRLDLRVPVGGLPYDLRLVGVAVDPDGVRLLATAQDVVLTR
jgi:hypothetical protein